MSLAAVFLAASGEARAAPGTSPPPAVLEETLARILNTARAAWPTFVLSDEVFLAHLAEQLPQEGELLATLRAVHAADLYLACGCARGEPRALAAFEAKYMSQVAAYLSRHNATPRFMDEVKQALRTRLLVSEREGPRIGRYSGQGPLGAWLRSATVRAAIDLQRQHNPADPGAREELLFRAAAPDPELTYLRTKYAEEFREAFQTTLQALSVREGNVLRLYFLDAMTAEDIGLLYKVSGRTVQRWISETRQKILKRTHKYLREKLKLSNTEIGALLALVESQADVSIARCLSRSRGAGEES